MKIFEVKKELFENDPDYKAMYAAMVAQTDKFCKEFHDDYNNMSEWGHNYFCPEDGAPLIFDFDKPTEHECSLCHTIHRTKTFDNVWTYFYRNEAILTLMKLSVMYKTEGKQEYLDEYKRILTYYSDNYTKFHLHAKHLVVTDVKIDVGGAGRLMPQGLNEAIVLIRICMTLEILKGDLDQAFLDDLYKNLFDNAMEILVPQIDKIHNIPCWLCSAVGTVGLVTGNQKLIDLVFKGEFGINEQLKQGVTADKFWYEGSIHYNFFLMEGVTYLLAFSKLYNQEFEAGYIIGEMLEQAYHYAFDNDILPNPNDGWPDVTLKSYSYTYCLASKVFGEDSTVGKIYKHILANPRPRVEIPLAKPFYFENRISFEHMVCLPEVKGELGLAPDRGSVCFKNSYFGMLKNDNINLFMKYGHRGPSHAHPDKMNIEVMVGGETLTRDLSNTGYASKLCNEWHRKSISHNTVLVDGQNHVSTDGGTVVEFTDSICHAKVENVYDGVDYSRRCEISNTGFTDAMVVESKTSHTYDWLFHCEATLVTKVDGVAGDLGYTENGYEHIKDLKKLDCGKELVLEWDLKGKKITSVINAEGKEVFMAQTYDNPVSRYRTAVILRTKAEKANFDAVWTVG